ncbi:MAG: putative sugar O-methyltransferase [Rhodospirillales bacterium]|nr:putative sugar O-methyltransferase [Rhodospirillales bacterium]
MALFTGNKALEALYAEVETPEAARSSYWEHEIQYVQMTADGQLQGKSVLGSVSTKMGMLNSAAHWVLQAPFRRMGRGLKDFPECQRLGRLVARRQGRQFTHDMVRQTLSLAVIRQHADITSEGPCNLIIGDGYGVMTSLALLSSPLRKAIAVNLTRSLLLDLTYISKAVPDAGFALVTSPEDLAQALERPDIRLIAVQADNAPMIENAPISLAINVHSMQEMDPPVIAGYFRILRANTADRTLFYCCNKRVKELVDGSKARFDDYPWHPDDQILVDEISAWSQMFYSKTPPFWHRRKGGDWATQHRLAYLHREKPFSFPLECKKSTHNDLIQ